MSDSGKITVTDPQGMRGTIDPSELAKHQIAVLLENGARVNIPLSALLASDEQTSSLPLRLSEVTRLHQVAPSDPVIPVVEEETVVGKRWVDGDRVRVRKVVQEREQTVNETLAEERVEIERVPVNRYIDEPIRSRQEGDTLIIPVIEETLVVRLLLKEEVRVTMRRTEKPISQPITLRKEDVVIERERADSKPD
jgi:stress response protein YsnF